MQMTQDELVKILVNHRTWLADPKTGSRADLSRIDLCHANLSWADLFGADLRHANLNKANLSEANLSGANLDFASWPLWCGSLRAKADEALCAQLAYHLARLMQHSGIHLDISIKDLANKAGIIARHDLPDIE